jgi:hypothetical protein
MAFYRLPGATYWNLEDRVFPSIYIYRCQANGFDGEPGGKIVLGDLPLNFTGRRASAMRESLQVIAFIEPNRSFSLSDSLLGPVATNAAQAMRDHPSSFPTRFGPQGELIFR